MPPARNIEIKARLKSWTKSFQSVRELSGASPEVLKQKDVYFEVPTGRLKLRIFDSEHGQLIRYFRPDTRGPKTSQFTIVPIDEPKQLLNVLGTAYGVKSIVRKTRYVFHYGRTRIHLDRVRDLGAFLELEVVLHVGEKTSEARNEALELMQRLRINEKELLRGSYADMIEESAIRKKT